MPRLALHSLSGQLLASLRTLDPPRPLVLSLISKHHRGSPRWSIPISIPHFQEKRSPCRPSTLVSWERQTLGPPGRRAFHISPRHPWHDGVLLMTPAIPGPSSLPLPTLLSLDTLPQPRRISRALRDTRPPTLAAAAESSCAHDCGSPAFQWSPAPFCPALLPPRGKPLNTSNLG